MQWNKFYKYKLIEVFVMNKELEDRNTAFIYV